MILEQKVQSTPQQVEKLYKKFHTTAEAMTPLSKCLFSGIQLDTENYLDNYVKFQGKLLMLSFLFVCFQHQVCLSMYMETGTNGNKINGNGLYERCFLWCNIIFLCFNVPNTIPCPCN